MKGGYDITSPDFLGFLTMAQISAISPFNLSWLIGGGEKVPENFTWSRLLCKFLQVKEPCGGSAHCQKATSSDPFRKWRNDPVGLTEPGLRPGPIWSSLAGVVMTR